jgi:RecA/RadA recombinase
MTEPRYTRAEGDGEFYWNSGSDESSSVYGGDAEEPEQRAANGHAGAAPNGSAANGTPPSGASGSNGSSGVDGDDAWAHINVADPERFEVCVLGLTAFDDKGRDFALSLTPEHFTSGRTRVLFTLVHEWYRVNHAPIEPTVLESRLVEAGRSAMEALELVLALQTGWYVVAGQAHAQLVEELGRRAAKRKHDELVLQALVALTPPRSDSDRALDLLQRAREISNDNGSSDATRPRCLPLPDAIVRSMAPLGPRMATGIKTLDDAIGGGIPLGNVAIFCGAPGAAKSGLAVWLVHQFDTLGAVCMYLAADEPARGILTRLGQLEGFERADLSAQGLRGEETRASFASRVRDRKCQTIVVDPAHDAARTIEEAHAELLALAGDRPRVLVIDSLQRARCLAADLCSDPRAKVNAKLDLLREQANGGTLIVLLSEMGRASYDIDAERNPLSAGKESGAIEYDGDIQINLYSVKDVPGVVDAVVAKSRLSAEKPRFRLRLDFARASFTEAEAPAGSAPVDRAIAKAAFAATRRGLETDALARKLAVIVEEHDGLGSVALRRAAKAKHGWGSSTCDRAMDRLRAGLDSKKLIDRCADPHVCEWVVLPDDVGGSVKDAVPDFVTGEES